MVALKYYAKEGVIAEGIETEEELKTVEEIGVSLVQGYLLGKPYAIRSGNNAAPQAVAERKRAANE